MKKLLVLALSLLTIVSCKKKEEDNVTPATTTATVEKTNGNIVKLTSVSTASTTDRYVDVTVSYLAGNTMEYNTDVMIVYYDSKAVLSRHPTVKGANKTESFKSPNFAKGADYKIYFIRGYVGSIKEDTLITLTGN